MLGKKYVAWVVALFILALATGYGWYVRILYNLKITALSQSSTAWGMWISFYILFVGLSAGAFLVSTLVYGFNLKEFEKVGRYALLTAILSLLGVLLSILPDLGRMERFLNIYLSPNFNSWMAIEGWMYLIYIIILLLELYLVSRRDFVHLSNKVGGFKASIYRLLALGKTEYSEAEYERDRKAVRVLALIGIPVAAIGVHGGTGAIFGVVGWRPIWFGAYTPIYFVLSALFSGAALVLALYTATNLLQGRSPDPEAVDSLAKIVVFLAFIELFFIFWEVVTNLWFTAPEFEKEVMKIILFGPYWWVFWIIEIIIGFIIPLGILMAKKPSSNPWLAALAGVLVVIGITGIRFNIVLPTLVETPFPVMPVEWDIKKMPWPSVPGYVSGDSVWVTNFSQGTYYFPTIWETLIQISVIATLLLLYSLLVKFLPMEVMEHE